MENIEKILKEKPREVSGSKTAKRYNYQKDFSLFLLLENHLKKQDYVFLFDFHDDLLMLDSETDPKGIDFYQIKTKASGEWSIADLVRRNKSALSILGKLYQNKIDFADLTNSLNYVSNARFKFQKLSDGTTSQEKSEIKCIELNLKDLKKIKEKLKEEHQLNEDPDVESNTTFTVSSLSLDDSSTHCEGAISQLLNKINPEHSVNANLAYKKLFNEINRKTEFNVQSITFDDFSHLIEKKGISKSMFEEILQVVGVYKSSEQLWTEIESSLSNSGLGYLELKQMKSSWRKMNALLLGLKNNTPLIKIVDSVKAKTDQIASEKKYESMNLKDLVDVIFIELNDLESNQFDELFIRSLIIKQLKDD